MMSSDDKQTRILHAVTRASHKGKDGIRLFIYIIILQKKSPRENTRRQTDQEFRARGISFANSHPGFTSPSAWPATGNGHRL